MSRLKKTVSLLGAGALAMSMAACGGDDSQEYCDLLEDSNNQFSELDPTDPEAQDEVQGVLNDVVDAAPDEVRDDWELFADTYEEMVNIDPSDQEAMEALQERQGEFEEATARISEHAQEECDLDLGM